MEHLGFSSVNTVWISPRVLGYFSDALEILLSDLFPRPPLHDWIRRKTKNDQSINQLINQSINQSPLDLFMSQLYVDFIFLLKPLEHLVALID